MIPDLAVVFAAGLGSRMKNFTKINPKPLAPALGRSLIDKTIEQLVTAGISRAVVNTHYKSQCIIDHLCKQNNGIEITIIEEPKLLETGGSLINILKTLKHDGKPVLTCNADTVWLEHASGESQLKTLFDAWDLLPKDKKLLMMISDRLHGGPEKYDFEFKQNRLCFSDNSSHHYVGYQIIDPSLLDEHAHKEIFSLSEVYKNLKQDDGFLRHAYGMPFSGMDIFHVGNDETIEWLMHYHSEMQRFAAMR